MPLPPAPAKRAALLSERDFDALAARLPQPRKTASPLAEPRLSAAPQARVASEVPATSRLAPEAAPADTSASRTRTPRPSPSARKVQPESDVQVQTPLFAPVAAPAPAPTSARTHTPADTKPRKAKQNGAAKLFVLDTNVLLHDPMCLFRFEEHDIFLPMIVLEELDAHKKGTTEVARNARQTSRSLDALAGHQGADITGGLPLNATGHREAGGKLFFQTQLLDYTLPTSLPQGKADNQILGVVQALRQQQARHELPASAREVVLVSKDINMRVKARALGLATDDYQNDKTLGDDDVLYSGAIALPANFWTSQAKTVESWQQGAFTFYRISGPVVASLLINQFVYFEAPGEPSLYARVTEIQGKTAVFKTLKDYTHLKNAVWGITSRNREQNFALNLLLDPEIDFVTLTGQAGTGKTLMALASGLTQVLDDRRYTEIIVTRATVSVGEDIGFLPGTEEEKMGPWMGALDDNLEVLGKTDTSAGEWGRAATSELIRSRIKIKSMNFMRGRTFLNKYVIIDEAQNLTPKQMKTLITRAGPGTKIICMGNLAQIDTPYLTEGSSGLTYAVDKFKGWAHGGHITLARGERSRLADFASEVL
ncbi:MAG: AAA family ATPase [Rhodoferax sp.]|uniref:PhoH family protein n=1 Tax=Rhodoferax sp. TaxID=50421 RepID=UPI00140010C0|nr:PhoH family protein [Rhodoferax sp.]NDP37243.1 AAA family ATPase [Rhodoferax sp.]